MSPDEKKLAFLNRIKLSALLLQNNRQSSHLGETMLVQADIDDLVDEFFAGCGECLTPDQYEKAKMDFNYFLALVDDALTRHSSSSRGNRVRSHP